MLLAKPFNLGTSKIRWDLLTMVKMTYRVCSRLVTCLNLIHCRLDSADLKQFLEMMDTIVTDTCFLPLWWIRFAWWWPFLLLAYQCSWLCLTFGSLPRLSNFRDVASCQGRGYAPNRDQCNQDLGPWCSSQRLPWLLDNPAMYPTTL